MVSGGCVVFVFVTKPATWFRRRPLQMIGQRSNNVRNLRKLSRRPILYENLVSIPLEALARLRFYALLIFLQCVHYMSELFQEEEKVREATEEGERVSARFGADLRSRWNVERWDLDGFANSMDKGKTWREYLAKRHSLLAVILVVLPIFLQLSGRFASKTGLLKLVLDGRPNLFTGQGRSAFVQQRRVLLHYSQ